MDSKMLPSIQVSIVLLVTVAGFLENRPIDAMVVAVLFALVSFIAYIPFIGFWMFTSAATRMIDWFGYHDFVGVAYWATTIWALVACFASSILVVQRIMHR